LKFHGAPASLGEGKKMKKIFEINYYQRTATGGVADASTMLYVVEDVLRNNSLEIVKKEGLKRMEKEYRAGKVHGYIQINHPSIMAGDWDEILLTFRNRALSALEERGLTIVNDYGVPFWK
jgi:2,4-dienoyl-CoA reductase-like NADH-dependent reductase (Old Yellow Enzyme family)